MHQATMRRALGLAASVRASTSPNPWVGCVIEPGGFGGATLPPGGAHAEVVALAAAGDRAAGATMVVTLEPCSHHGRTPPCVDAIIAAGIARVVSALEDPNPKIAGEGHAMLREAGVTVTLGVCADEARRAHAGHISRVRLGRPHVTLKLAVSADGKAGLAARRPAAITGEAARERVQMMRAMNDAVVTGIGTVLADDPQLTCRLPGMEQRSPVRVVLDSSLRMPLQSKLATSATRTLDWVFVDQNANPAHEAELSASGVEVLRVPGENGRLELMAVLRALAGRGVTRVMVEAGPILSAAFVGADLVDEAALFHSPNALGEGIDALEGMP